MIDNDSTDLEVIQYQIDKILELLERIVALMEKAR